MDTALRRSTTMRLHQEVLEARAHTDALFGLVAAETLYERPIADRHRLVFYVGHVDAFDWNQLGRGVLDLPSFHPTFDQLFGAGIDPPPGQAPADAPADWPALAEVLAYVARARRRLDEIWSELPAERVLTALEHRWMHAETLCYLLHQLEASKKRLPSPPPRTVVATAVAPAPDRDPWVAIPAGPSTLGQGAGEFGWDNEFPQHGVENAEFEIARYKLTHGEYLRYVEAGGPAPHFWRRRNGNWWLRRMFDEVPLLLDAPVFLTHRQAVEYADWVGARLPTEAEWQRAAYGHGERRYPWGEVEPDARRANLGFVAWDPWPVRAQPTSATALGVEQMLGNGWEWTSSVFTGFPGFTPRTYYPGYSADFFDGAHFVMKGASPRTARRLARPSFRNWFRAEYPYAYATVRLARGQERAGPERAEMVELLDRRETPDRLRNHNLRTPRFIEDPASAVASLAAEATAGLAEQPARVPPKFFYDALGSRLFEAITELPEYYLTRTEAAIFAAQRDVIGTAVAGAVGRGPTLIDLGAGNCEKAERLFDSCAVARYVAVDISTAYLRVALERLQQRHPQIDISGVALDFSVRLALPDDVAGGPSLLFYPGSSIGNFAPGEALRLLREAHLVSGGGALLIGVDLVKPADVLEAAYDDALGVTAAFNLNVLRHLNGVLGADFDVRGWRHVAFFDPAASRIEMHLEARHAVTVHWPLGERRFDAGERIRTEDSYKWTRDGFEALLREAGFRSVRTWTDARDWFALMLAVA